MQIFKTLILIAGVLLLACTPALGYKGIWGPAGVMVCNEGGSQENPAIGAYTDGSAMVVWQDSGIYAQKLDSQGDSVWASRVMVSGGAKPAIGAYAADGSAMVVWQDSGSIYAQRLDSQGNIQWASRVMVSGGGNPDIGAYTDGSAMIVWEDSGIYAQKLDGQGNSQWASRVMVNNEGWNPAIGAYADGSAMIMWEQGMMPNMNVYAQRLDSQGNIQWADKVKVSSTGADFYPAISSYADGSAIIMWHYAFQGMTFRVYAQKLANDGSIVWPNSVVLCGEENNPGLPAIGAYTEGSAIIVWPQDQESSPRCLYAQKIAADGITEWPDSVRLSDEGGEQKDPAISSYADGSTIIVWQDKNAPWRIYAQKLLRPEPKITGLSPDNSGWGGMAKDILISGSSFLDSQGHITYTKLTPTAETGREIAGLNLRNLTAHSFTCDFDLRDISGEESWHVVVYDSVGQTGTADGILFRASQPNMQALTWTSALAGEIYTGTEDNLAGQINCAANGCDWLQSLTVENAERWNPAEADKDIPKLSLWHGMGGSDKGITFNPATADRLGIFNSIGAKTWTISLGGDGVKIEDNDALYLTMDISGGARAGRTCRFCLLAEACKFKHQGNLPETDLVSMTEQSIRKAASCYLDFISLAPVNIAENQKAVNLGRIKIINAKGKNLDITSLLISLTDKAGKEHALGAIFDRIWIEQGGIRLAELCNNFSVNKFTISPLLSLAGNAEVLLNLTGDIRSKPEVKSFFVGLANGLCLNNGEQLGDAVPGKEFPLMGSQVNIRARELKAVFSSYPNPFQAGKESAGISYYLKAQGRVKIEIRTLTGRLIKMLEDKDEAQGTNETSWDGRNERGYMVKSGVYLLRVQIRYVDGTRERQVRKIAVVK